MPAYLVNHLRLPNDVPRPDALTYLENVEATFRPYGGRWLALDQPVESRREIERRRPEPTAARRVRIDDDATGDRVERRRRSNDESIAGTNQ